jgi:hypothetical protein
MTKRDWKYFKYEIAEFFFGKELDETFREGQHSGVEYTSRTLGMAIRTIDESKLTKTQRVGLQVAREAISDAKKEVMRKTGVAL